MKRFNFIGFFILLALVAMGIGYASWTDSVIVKSTIGTGEMNVTFIECEVPCTRDDIWDQASVDNGYDDDGKGLDYSDKKVLYAQLSSTIVNPKETEVTVTNVYPGVAWETGHVIKNTGTIPAVFDYVTLEYEDSDELERMQDAIEITALEIYGYDEAVDEWAQLYDLNVDDKSLGELENILIEALTDIRLEQNEKICIVLSYEFPETVDDLELTTIEYSIIINFRQHNVLPSDPDDDNGGKSCPDKDDPDWETNNGVGSGGHDCGYHGEGNNGNNDNGNNGNNNGNNGNAYN